MFIFDDILFNEDGGEGGSGGNGSAPDPEKEKNEAELKRARAEAAENRKRAKEAEEKLAAAEAARAAAEDEKLSDERKYKELADKRAAEIAKLNAKITELEGAATELETMRTARRTELVDRLPEGLRAEFEGDGVTIAELERAVKMAEAMKPAGSERRNSTGSDPAGEGTGTGAALSEDDLLALKKSDPAAYQKQLMSFGAAGRSAAKTIFS